MPVLVDGTIIAPPPPTITVPTEPAFQRQGMRNIWTGWDGSVWDLSDESGGVLLSQGVSGHSMPPVEQYRSQAPSIPGSQWRGSRVQNRDVMWPLYVYSDGSESDWADLDRAFWVTMDPNHTGTWSVIQPGGVTRSIDLRYVSDSSSYTMDPFFTGWALYGLSLTADQPFWREDPQVRTFRAHPPAPLFAGPGVLQVNSAQQLGAASINNPGNVNGWVTWTLAGPFTSAVVGVAGKTIEVPFPLASGEFLSLYPQPELQIAIDGNQNDRTDELGAVDWNGSGLAPGVENDLSLQLVNAGDGAYIEAALTPYFFRAW